MGTLKIKCAKIRANPDFRQIRPVACIPSYRVSHRDSSWISKGIRDLGRPRRLQSGREYFYDRYLSCIFIPSHPGVLAPRTERSRARNPPEIPRFHQTRTLWEKLRSTIGSPTVVHSTTLLNHRNCSIPHIMPMAPKALIWWISL